MTLRQHTISTPWDVRALRVNNGRHPLPESLIEDTDEFHFASELQPLTEAALARSREDAAALSRDFAALSPRVDEAAIVAFVASRDVSSQAEMAVPADLLFLHTCPMTFGRRPWAIHIETILPMFEPYFGHFRTWDIDLDAQPAYHMVRRLVRDANCRAIFTHIRRTRDTLPVLFADQSLAAKIHYAPLGLHLGPDARRVADEAVARKNAKGADDEFVVLFTNSWHQMGDSFFKRGGMEALMGFLLTLENRPNCRLILRTPLPRQLNDGMRAFLRGHRQIELHENPVSDGELFQMLARADAFLLPSANLHTISMLRAMAFGAIVITTDVFAVEEFIAHGENGVILPGRRESTYHEDNARGLLRERADPLVEVNAVLTTSIAATLQRLVDDRELRKRLRIAARNSVDAAHAMGPWRDGFHGMLRSSLTVNAA